MHITQTDIAHLSDVQAKRLVIGLHAAACTSEGGPAAVLVRQVAQALTRAIRERRQLALLLELDAMNADDDGGLVEPGSDPVGEARAQLRRGFGC